jgi:hypothetical protein
METVDYLKLSEQYASFLVAVGGVSITVLTLVLSLGSDLQTPTKVNSRSFLVAALAVATITCFIGAHMMAETAAFIEFHNKTQPPSPTGERLFLLATINIFIAIILVLFALMLLPMSSRRVHAASITPFSVGIFLIILGVALYWMILAACYRMPVPQSALAISLAVLMGLLWGGLLWVLPEPNKYSRWISSKKRLRWTGRMEGLLLLTFAPSAFSATLSLIWFAWIFSEGNTIHLHKARNQDIWFFCIAIALSYAPLVVAAIKTMLGKQFADVES